MPYSNLTEFLELNRIDRSSWDDCGLTWEVLSEIGRDHETNRGQLANTAEFFARTLQGVPGVHSIRSRVKDTDHLLEKIARKCIEKNVKYAGVNVDNYYALITDLVGVRALHLFKEDCFPIHDAITKTWENHETPTAYVRDGDPAELAERFRGIGLQVKSHKDGYRSVHYVCAAQPLKRKVLAEVQVRTIFEEGWSEIDHRVRYPNYSDNQLVAYFLMIFNRLAGSADEMGTFVQGLSTVLSDNELRIRTVQSEKEVALEKMTLALDALSAMRKQDDNSRAQIDSLRAEVSKLRGMGPQNYGLLAALPDRAATGLVSEALRREFLDSLAISRQLSPQLNPTVGGLLSTGEEMKLKELIDRKALFLK